MLRCGARDLCVGLVVISGWSWCVCGSVALLVDTAGWLLLLRLIVLIVLFFWCVAYCAGTCLLTVCLLRLGFVILVVGLVADYLV